jgi:hypothetical protein
MLADEILATITERPGIKATEIRAAFPDVNRKLRRHRSRGSWRSDKSAVDWHGRRA